MISIVEALQLIEKETEVLNIETVDLIAGLGLVLAEDIYAKDNLPPFDKSAMDGYVIRSEDTQELDNNYIGQFEIMGMIKAGEYPREVLQKGQCYKIMTGASLPEGGNAVIEIEKVVAENGKLLLSQRIKEGNHVIKLGEEIQEGQVVLPKETTIRPVEIGLLASLGYSTIKVYQKPRISLIITGDELVDIHVKPENGKIRNSNEYSLKAMTRLLGVEAECLGILPDNRLMIKERIKASLEHSDIVISSGGASVGDFDFIEEILMELGAEVKFNSVAIKPGKPITFATFGKKLFFSLPGNPLSFITTFEEFVKPAVLKIMGRSHKQDEFPVTLKEDFEGLSGRVTYIYVKLQKEDGNYYAYSVGSQSSNHLYTMSKANGLIILPKGCVLAKAGEVVTGRYLFT